MSKPVFRGRLPSNLLRFFHERDHAVSFLDGCVRLGELWGYRKVEGARQDASEGEGRLVVPGVKKVPVNFGISFHNPVYILSLCSPRADLTLVSRRFGRFVVRVRHANVLAGALFRRLARSSIAGRDLLFGERGAVVYTKDEAVARTPRHERRVRLSWMQKPPDFVGEREYRIAFAFSGPRPDAPFHICVPLSRPVDGEIDEVDSSPAELAGVELPGASPG